ncbi:MAG: DUF1365 domain-containing protein [Pseudoruegeria sp.]
MMHWPQHIRGETCHVRRGKIANTFRYGVDYVLIDPEANHGPLLFSRNRWNLLSVLDRDHGGQRDAGEGLSWARGVLEDHGCAAAQSCKILLMTQPRCLGYAFNPVSFWLAYLDDLLVAVIAEVNNTYGGRHNYVCANLDFAPIAVNNALDAKKVFHVSPFQDVGGSYRFRFNIKDDGIAIRIAFRHGSEGVIATLTGDRIPLSNASILTALMRRPFGALRTVALIYRQALRLKLKGAFYRPSPPPSARDVT